MAGSQPHAAVYNHDVHHHDHHNHHHGDGSLAAASVVNGYEVLGPITIGRLRDQMDPGPI